MRDESRAGAVALLTTGLGSDGGIVASVVTGAAGAISVAGASSGSASACADTTSSTGAAVKGSGGSNDTIDISDSIAGAASATSTTLIDWVGTGEMSVSAGPLVPPSTEANAR